MRRLSLFFLFLVIQSPFLVMSQDLGYQGPANWAEFQSYIQQKQEEEERLGVAYMISGALAVIGGTVGYQEANESLSRTIFALTSNIGFAGLGLGASHYFVGSSVNSFFYAVDGMSLSAADKNELLQRYLYKEKLASERRRWIQVTTHALLAAANLYSASREDGGHAHSVFTFLAGANLLLAVTYSF